LARVPELEPLKPAEDDERALPALELLPEKPELIELRALDAPLEKLAWAPEKPPPPPPPRSMRTPAAMAQWGWDAPQPTVRPAVMARAAPKRTKCFFIRP
jgi:hypothetical protein